jgi:UDP-N-acetylmuramoyl-tripeptide--D-alanyl-D-alanine ligase
MSTGITTQAADASPPSSSVNTPMGVTRIIREQLDDAHRYFIVEMGAYGRGSVERLCRLAPPDIGVITAIGQAHYERSKSLDTVAETKFELAESVLQNGTAVMVHENCLRFAPAHKMAAANRAKFIICGAASTSDLQINQVVQRASGVEVSLTWKSNPYTLTLPLFGIHHGHNAAVDRRNKLGAIRIQRFQFRIRGPYVNHEPSSR